MFTKRIHFYRRNMYHSFTQRSSLSAKLSLLDNIGIQIEKDIIEKIEIGFNKMLDKKIGLLEIEGVNAKCVRKSILNEYLKEKNKDHVFFEFEARPYYTVVELSVKAKENF